MIASRHVAPLRGYCGPLHIAVRTSDERFASVTAQYFDLYGEPLSPISRRVEVDVGDDSRTWSAEGRFLSCARMNVDRHGDVYVASTASGFAARGIIGGKVDIWKIAAPPLPSFSEAEGGDIEDLLGLICTVGWRLEGFIAVHAAAVVKGDRCVILCAPSGGGKSTLTVALLRNGWRALGDDKLLLRHGTDGPELTALLQTFNVHPRTRTWFPEMADLEALPRYSSWTEKRRVSVASIASAGAITHARPTHVTRVGRKPWSRGVCATAMPHRDVLPMLLQQIVLPTDREICSSILRTVSRCATQLHGSVLEVGDDAYSDPQWLRVFEDALQ